MRRLLVVGLAVPVMALTACGGDVPGRTGQSKPPAPPGGSTQPKDLSARAEEIASYCRAQFPEVFAGVAIDPDNARRIAVYRLRSPALDRAVQDRFADAIPVFRDAPASERDLDELVQRVLADRAQWLQRGIDVKAVGADFVLGSVEVLTPDAAAARRALPAEYGRRITVREGSITPVPGGGSG